MMGVVGDPRRGIASNIFEQEAAGSGGRWTQRTAADILFGLNFAKRLTRRAREAVAILDMMHRPPVIRDQDTIALLLTRESEYRIPFTFIEALNEGTLYDRPAHVFREAARERRLFHVLNKTTENIIGTGVIQLVSGEDKPLEQAEVGGLMFHPGARGFGIASLLLKVMMVYAVKESGRDSRSEQYLAHVVDGNGGPIHALLDAGFKAAGHVEVRRGEIDAVIDHMVKDGESAVRLQAFVFDRRAIGNLVLSLWKFVREDDGLIARSDPAGDVRITVDFSHVIKYAHLDAQVELLKQGQ